ncbi:replication protein, partial [Acinetobacter seifertii]
MQINPKYTNNPAFNKSFPAISEVTSAKKSAPLGTITKSCSIVDLKGKIYDKDKAREYRKSTTQLKERAGEILYVPNQKKQHRVCACGKCRIDGTAPV